MKAVSPGSASLFASCCCAVRRAAAGSCWSRLRSLFKIGMAMRCVRVDLRSKACAVHAGVLRRQRNRLRGWQPRQRARCANHSTRCVLSTKGGNPASDTPAPESLATVASFRTWRGLQAIVARAPTGPPLSDAAGWLRRWLDPADGKRGVLRSGGERGIRTLEAGFSRLHTFQACSFNHSDTSPESLQRSILPTLPHCCPLLVRG
jgi:hypothetical protein